MSGGYGWHQSSNTQSTTDHSYDDAKKQYQTTVTQPAVTVKKIGAATEPVVAVKPIVVAKPIVQPVSVWPKRNINTVMPTVIKSYPEAKHALKSTASNVIIIVQDVTVSVSAWLLDIFSRMPTLYIEACQYLGTDDLEILFIAHGDVRTDNFPVQVSRFGRGEELDMILGSFYTRCGGGGQGDESQEIVAYYLLKQVDTTSAQNVYTYFITDEAACEILDPEYVKEYLDLPMDNELIQTKDVFAGLQRRGKVFTVLCETKNSQYDVNSIRKSWENNIGKDNVIPLNDSRRVVDVILGSIAKLTGELAQFTQNLITRQKNSKYAAQNVQTVQNSIALIGGNLPLIPQDKIKKSLI